MIHHIEILIAEDEEHIAKLVAFKLSKEGFGITVARNGQEALDRLATRAWSLIILDVMMPVLDGWQVLKAIRQSDSLSTVPILMLTAKGDKKDMANAAELGATRFLKKPFDPAELAEVVREMVTKK